MSCVRCRFCNRLKPHSQLHWVKQLSVYCSEDCAWAGMGRDFLRHRFVNPMTAYAHFVDEVERIWGA